MALQYIGARYVPRFMGTHDNTQVYEALDVVDNGLGTSYIAKIPTPAGTPLTNTTYWALYGASSGAIVNLQNQIDDMKDGTVPGSLQEQINTNASGITALTNGLTPLIGGYVTPEAYGAEGDGVTDDTAAINACLAHGGYIIFKAGATYMVDAETNLLVESDSVIDLNNATIKAIPNSNDYYNIFMIDGKHNVVIKNGTIIGDKDNHGSLTGEWGYGVYVHESKDVILENLNISKCWGDGIAITSHSVTPQISNNIHVNDCTIRECRRQGISVMWCYDVFIDGNLIEDIGGTAPGGAIDVEPNPNQSTNHIIITNNMMYNCIHGLIISGAATGATLDNVIVDGNIIKNDNATQAQISVAKGSNIKITNNDIEVTTSTVGFMSLSRATDFVFEGNTLHDSNNTGNGLYISGSSGVVRGNYFVNYTISYNLLYLNESTGISVVDNTFNGCSTDGSHFIVNLLGSSGVPLEKCNISHNHIVDCTTKTAVYLAGYCIDNHIVNNDIRGTYDYTISSNTATNSDNVAAFNDIKSGSSGNITGYGGTFPGTKAANIIDGVYTA